jgi:hypothetical protein
MRRTEGIVDKLADLLLSREIWSYTDLRNEIKNKTGDCIRTADRRVSDFIHFGYLIKNENGSYIPTKKTNKAIIKENKIKKNKSVVSYTSFDGKEALLLKDSIIGIENTGGFAEFVIMPGSTIKTKSDYSQMCEEIFGIDIKTLKENLF